MTDLNSPLAGWHLTRDDIDSVKGLFMSLIVVCHLTVFSQHFEPVFIVIYNFHVAGLMLLTFTLSSTGLRRNFVMDRAIRYLFPYVIFAIVTGIVYYVFLARATGEGALKWFLSLVTALVLGNEELLRKSAGLRIYWFLPALFSLIVLKYFFDNQSTSGKIYIFFLATIVHLFIGAMSSSVRQLFPFGIHVALYLFPLGIVVAEILRRTSKHNRTVVAVLATSTWIGCILGGIYFRSYSGLGSALNVHSVYKPMNLIFHDIYVMAAFISVLSLSHLLAIGKVFTLIGRYSFMIFLTHSVIWQFLVRTGLWGYIEGLLGLDSTILQTAVAFLAVMILSVSISVVVGKSALLTRILFPRTAKEFVLAVAGGAKA